MDNTPVPRKAGKQAADIAQQTKRDIVEAAFRVFAVYGFEGVSLRDIAQEAGTTHGLIRHYFGTKEGIWRAAVDTAIERYTTALTPYAQQVVQREPDPMTLAEAVVRSFIHVSAQHPEIVRLILHEGTTGGARLEYALARFAPLGSLFAPLLERMHHQGRLQHFDNRTFFIFLYMTGAAPFALSPLVEWVTGEHISTEEQMQHHAVRVIATLFGGGITS